MEAKRARFWSLVAATAAAVLLLGVGLPLFIYDYAQPPPGAPLATLDVRSGEPFELRFTSDGRPARVFLDMECESCSFPVTGEMRFAINGDVFEKNAISTGSCDWGGTGRQLEKQLVFSAPERPAGAEITLRGSLVVERPRSKWNKAPIESAPPPRVTLLRVTVAH